MVPVTFVPSCFNWMVQGAKGTSVAVHVPAAALWPNAGALEMASAARKSESDRSAHLMTASLGVPNATSSNPMQHKTREFSRKCQLSFTFKSTGFARVRREIEQMLFTLIAEILPCSPIRAAACGRARTRQNTVRSNAGRLPAQTAITLSPSNGYAGSAFAPATSRKVADQSMVSAAWLVTLPAGTTPGQRTMAGIRIPAFP